MYYITVLLLALALLPLGIGVFISMRIFNIPDITTDGSYTLGAAVTAVLLMNGESPYLVLPCSIGAGMLAGMTTGFIHAKLKVDALLSGILVMTALYSVNISVMGRSNIPLIKTNTLFNLSGLLGDEKLSLLGVLMIIVFLIWSFMSWLMKTDFGLAMRATGNNITMARAVGVNTSRMKITGLAIANGCVALSGSLVAQLQGFADISMGIGIIIAGLGAVMIGEALLKSLKIYSITFRLLGVIIGSIIFRFVLAFVLQTGIDPNLLKLFTAIIVLIVVAIPALSKKANN